MFGLFHWAVPWRYGEVVNTCFLTVSTVIVVAIPTIYAWKANFRDPLARSVLAGTGAPALAFLLTLVSLIAYHAGWNPPIALWNWLQRVLYIAVALGGLTLLIAFLRLPRRPRGDREGDRE